jgi:hypothetical protein
VDWLTPFSLLYLYKHIGVKKEKSFAKSHDSSDELYEIKMLIKYGETQNPSSSEASNKSYKDVEDTN